MTTVVSFKIPVSLYDSLEKNYEKDHYLDMSEAVRGIIRDKWKEDNKKEARILLLKKTLTDSKKEELLEKLNLMLE